MAVKRKRTARWLGAIVGVLVLLLLALVLAPLFFGDRLIQLVVDELNQSLTAEISYEDADLSLLTNFPSATVQLEGLRVGRADVEPPLLVADRLDVAFGLFTVFRDDRVRVDGIHLAAPIVSVLTYEDGTASYDVLPEEPEEEEPSSSVTVQLDNVTVSDGELFYEDADTKVSLKGLEAEAEARIDSEAQELSLEVRSQTTVQLGTSTYLDDRPASLAVSGSWRPEPGRLELQRIVVTVGELALSGEGVLTMATGEDPTLTASLETREDTSLKSLLSLLPSAYRADFDGLRASGEVAIRAEVDGPLIEDESALPSFRIEVRIADGRFKYPDLPLPVENIALRGELEHPGGALNKLVVRVPTFGFRAGESRANGRLVASKLLSNPRVDLELDADVRLADLADAYPIPDVSSLGGKLDVKMDVAGTKTDVERLEGKLRATDVRVELEDAAPVEIATAEIDLDPRDTRLLRLDATTGSTDVSLRGRMPPLLELIDSDQELQAELTLQSKRFAVKDFLTESKDEAATRTTAFVFPDGVDATLGVDIGELVYDEVVIRDVEGRARLRDRALTIQRLRGKALGGIMSIKGTVATPPDAPARFDLSYEIERAEFSQAFSALNTVERLAPIAEFMSGNFSTSLRAEGTLGDDMLPNLGTLDLSGLLVASKSKIEGLPPLQALSKAVPSVPASWNLPAIQSRFQVEDGKVRIREFPVRVNGTEFRISGSHGLDREMDYRISFPAPLDELRRTELAGQVEQLGVDTKKLTRADVVAKLGGSIRDPRVTFDVRAPDAREAVEQVVQEKVDEVRAVAEERVSKEAERLLAEAQEQADNIVAEAERAADKIRREADEKADGLVKEAGSNPLKRVAADQGAKAIRSNADKAADRLVDEARDRADEVMKSARERVDRLP